MTFATENKIRIKFDNILQTYTVWLCFDNALTSWNKNPPVDEENCQLVKKYAKLEIWILNTKDELETAVNQFHADIVETTGNIRPDMLNYI